MKFSLVTTSFKPEVVLEHGTEQLKFSVGVFARETLETDYNIFVQINAYWAQLERFRVDAIFEIYKQIREAYDDVELLDRAVLTTKLQELIGNLYAYHPMAEVRHWALFKCDTIRIPSCLEAQYVPNNDQPGSREQTYLRDEYVDLVTYSLLTRLMFPIWGEYIQRAKTDVGTAFKEYYAYHLLMRTELVHCPAVLKLRDYIVHNSPADPPASAIIGGMSSEEYPVWVLALVVTRRVCIGDLQGLDPTTPKLVKYVYNFIIQKVQGSETNFDNVGKVSPKKMDMSGGDEEDTNGSRFEAYKLREDITIGDKAFLTYCMSDIVKESARIVPELSAKVVMRALQTSEELLSQPLNTGQITLAKWIFKAVISPRAFDYFGKVTVAQALAGAQCILWHWGYKDLAILASARPVPERSERTVRIASTDVKKYLPELQELFPYDRRAGRSGKEKVNQVLPAFDLMAEHFNANDWYATVDASLLSEAGYQARLFSAPTNIRARLAELVLQHVSKLSLTNPHSILPSAKHTVV